MGDPVPRLMNSLLLMAVVPTTRSVPTLLFKFTVPVTKSPLKVVVATLIVSPLGISRFQEVLMPTSVVLSVPLPLIVEPAVLMLMPLALL